MLNFTNFQAQNWILFTQKRDREAKVFQYDLGGGKGFPYKNGP